MFKSRISLPIRIRFLKNLVLQALGTIWFRFLQNKSKKNSCLCTFKSFKNTVSGAVSLRKERSSDRCKRRQCARARICKCLRSPGIDSNESILPAHILTARLHRLAESIPWNPFLGSLNVYKFGLSFQKGCAFTSRKNIEYDKEDLPMSSLIFYLKAGNWGQSSNLFPIRHLLLDLTESQRRPFCTLSLSFSPMRSAYRLSLVVIIDAQRARQRKLNLTAQFPMDLMV